MDLIERESCLISRGQMVYHGLIYFCKSINQYIKSLTKTSNLSSLIFKTFLHTKASSPLTPFFSIRKEGLSWLRQPTKCYGSAEVVPWVFFAPPHSMTANRPDSFRQYETLPPTSRPKVFYEETSGPSLVTPLPLLKSSFALSLNVEPRAGSTSPPPPPHSMGPHHGAVERTAGGFWSARSTAARTTGVKIHALKKQEQVLKKCVWN